MQMPLAQALDHSFYKRTTEVVARELIGRTLIYHSEAGPVGGVIVETEAYGPGDPANHAFRGSTARNSVMFGPPGFAYVYRIYGIHWCLNAVTGAEGVGEAVLLRALRPTAGLEIMRRNRGQSAGGSWQSAESEPSQRDERLCRGPGALCAALGITGELNGADLSGPALAIFASREDGADGQINATTRIGLTKATDRLCRFYWSAPPALRYVSGPRRALIGSTEGGYSPEHVTSAGDGTTARWVQERG